MFTIAGTVWFLKISMHIFQVEDVSVTFCATPEFARSLDEVMVRFCGHSDKTF